MNTDTQRPSPGILDIFRDDLDKCTNDLTSQSFIPPSVPAARPSSTEVMEWEPGDSFEVEKIGGKRNIYKGIEYLIH